MKMKLTGRGLANIAESESPRRCVSTSRSRSRLNMDKIRSRARCSLTCAPGLF
jgi:hypothetical protein